MMTDKAAALGTRRLTQSASAWNNGTLADVIDDVRGGFSVNCENRPAKAGELGILKTSSVLSGRFRSEENKAVMPKESARVRTKVTEGTIIFCRKNSEEVIGVSALVNEGLPNLFLSDLLWQITPADGVSRHWLSAVLASDRVRSLIRIASSGTQASMKNISQDRLLVIPVPIPPLAEQCEIASILRTWDEALNKLTTLRARKSSQLTGLTQRLLGRGGAFPERWSLKPLSVIATRIRRENGGGSYPVMTISARSGFLMQSDKFARDMAGSSVDRYTLLREGEFAYNKGNSLAAPYGCIYRLDRPAALVPFVYFCFALMPKLDHSFYEHLFAAGALNHQLSRLINSGVRNDGLLNLNVEDFFGCRVPCPPLDEQRRIALALSAAKEELILLDQEIEALARQKRGLMQKLLTGEWRVKGEVN
jgi:type I restriction enzyme S subunit